MNLKDLIDTRLPDLDAKNIKITSDKIVKEMQRLIDQITKSAFNDQKNINPNYEHLNYMKSEGDIARFWSFLSIFLEEQSLDSKQNKKLLIWALVLGMLGYGPFEKEYENGADMIIYMLEIADYLRLQRLDKKLVENYFVMIKNHLNSEQFDFSPEIITLLKQ